MPRAKRWRRCCNYRLGSFDRAWLRGIPLPSPGCHTSLGCVVLGYEEMLVTKRIVMLALIAACLGSASGQEVGAIRQAVVDKPELLAGAIAVTDGRRANDVVWLRLTQAQVPEPSAQALRAWVNNGGTLWTETDAAAVFGLRVLRPTMRELYGHGRRACAPMASPLVAGVNDIWYRLEPTAAFLGPDPRLLALLRVADPTEPPTVAKLVSAELSYGSGRVIHRPSEIHQTRADGKTFEANLRLGSTPSLDEVVIPVETLTATQKRCAETVALVAKPEQAADLKNRLLSVFLAYRLWWAEHLTNSGKFDDALAQLRAVAADLPQDPDVYLAVAHWNERQNRQEAADQARGQATAAYAAAKRAMPSADTKRLRVPWSSFVLSVNAAGTAWDKPTRENVALVAARTNHLVALDNYRRGELATAERLWQEAFRSRPDQSLTPFYLGLTYRTWADDPRASGRERVAWYNTAAGWFDATCLLPPTTELDAPALGQARNLAETSRNGAVQSAKEPPDVLARGGFIYRYDAADPRFRTSPLLASLQASFDSAYQGVAQYGVWLDPTEVLLPTDDFALRTMLPSTGVTRQIYPTSATAGRRIYLAGTPLTLDRQCRHEFVRVVCNALTEGGFPPPVWFEVGLASSAENDDYRSRLAGINIRGGRVMSIEQLNDAQNLRSRDALDHCLGQSELMVKALLVRFGPQTVVPFLMSMGWGASPEVAFVNWTGLGQAQFLTAWVNGQFGAPGNGPR